MNPKDSFAFIKNLKHDLPSSIIVFLVAIPLCLGIAAASGVPLISGLIAGMIGGIVVTMISGSSLGVSGPAAGLVAIVVAAQEKLGSLEFFFIATALAGIIQAIMGLLRGGIIAYYFPNSVIKGMLAGIGIIIIMKMIPDAFGFPADAGIWQGFMNFGEMMNPASLAIAAVGMGILLLWEQPFMKSKKIFQLIQGPLIAVIAGILMNIWFGAMEGFGLNESHMVTVPNSESVKGFFQEFPAPSISAYGEALMTPQVYITALTIAVVASLETLLCLEATDKLDPWKRVSPTNRELYAQGAGNIVSGLVGGLPITQVIVRSSTNIQSGARTKSSAFFHGILIFFGTMLIPGVLNMIPLASLAVILFMVGYKLAKPSLFKEFYKLGKLQFAPFMVTIIGIVVFDLLVGIGLGMALAVFFILRNNLRNAYRFHIIEDEAHKKVHIELSEDVSFLNKAAIQKTLKNIPNDYHVLIDGSETRFMHQDVYDIIHDFEKNAETRDISVEFKEPQETHDMTDVELFNQRMKEKRTRELQEEEA